MAATKAMAGGMVEQDGSYRRALANAFVGAARGRRWVVIYGAGASQLTIIWQRP